MTMDIVGEDFDERVPAAWSPNSDPNGVGGILRKVIPAYGTRIDDSSDSLAKSLQKEAASPIGSKGCVVRITPKGGKRDAVECLSWAPKAWMNKSMVPEALRSFGPPWLVGGLPGSCRIGVNGWPVPGMGQFLIQIKVSSILVTFPIPGILGAWGNHGGH